MLSCLLTEMDGVLGDIKGDDQQSVVIVGTTSHREGMDDAILRPGRLDQHILVPLPDDDARRSILKKKMVGMPVEGGIDAVEELLDALVEKTVGFSGADLENVCREAALEALRRDIRSEFVSASCFLKALELLAST